MRYSVKSGAIEKINTDCLVVGVWHKGSLTEEAKAIDAATGKALGKVVKSGDCTGKVAETTLLYGLDGISGKRVLLLGVGDKKKLDAGTLAKALQAAIKALTRLEINSVHFAVSSLQPNDRDGAWLATQIARSAEDLSYRYRTTKSKQPKAISLRTVSISTLAGCGRKALDAALQYGQQVGKAMNTAKELGNLPGNICTPTFLANAAQSLADKHKSISTQVLSEKQMSRLGMGSLLSVSAGSIEEAKLIVMQYKGAKAASRPYALVGKGITFDTGGISLKGGAGMDEMKFDMCGAASVIAVLGCVAALKLPVNVVGIVAAAENMPGSKASKPGDIVTSMSGKTIEILNTDAEGRLVLCDALTYVEKFKPRAVIDIATLTGAAVATFGSFATAVLSNNDKLSETLLDCGQHTLDKAWPLPLWDEYQSLLDSNFADIANIGGPKGGTITAACFLSRFTEKQQWAHLDIAGSAWHSGAAKGATGRPVSLLVEYLKRQKAG